MVTFISGGARSGKSSFAEKLVLTNYQNQTEGKLYYIATSMPSDDEMKARILKHRSERVAEWHTIEAPVNVSEALAGIEEGSSVLIDCLTIWTSNMLYVNNAELGEMRNEIDNWMATASERQLFLAVVSNDINEGMPSSYDSVASYIYVLEQLHQRMIAAADEVYQIVAGLPQKWKGG